MSQEDVFEEIGAEPEPEKKTLKEKFDDGVRSFQAFSKRRDVREKVRRAELLFKIAKEVKPDNPFSVAHAFAKTVETLYEFDKTMQPLALRKFEKLRGDSQEVAPSSVTHLFLNLVDLTKLVEEESSPSSTEGVKGPTVYSYLCEDVEGQLEPFKIYWYQQQFDFSEIICDKDLPLKEVRRCLSELLWGRYGRQIELEWSQDREFDFRSKDPPKWKYEGDFGKKLVARWNRALDIGMRRFIILHGDPGMGKSTLARHLGMSTNRRVLFVPTAVISHADSVVYFTDTVSLFSPDIVVMDDIDRMGRSTLDELLSLFEETETDIPLLLATTNDLDELSEALKRPGRFDETWLIASPPPKVMGRVVRYLASLEGLELNDEQVQAVGNVAVSKELSGAHIREILRRVILEEYPSDWKEIQFDPRDITFSEKWRPRNYKQDGVARVSSFDDEYDEYDEYDDFDDFDD